MSEHNIEKEYIQNHRKAKSVISSCKTEKQLDVALEFCKRVVGKWSSHNPGIKRLMSALNDELADNIIHKRNLLKPNQPLSE